MKRTLFFLVLGLLLATTAKGQIKIGDNPQTIDPSSVLELESGSRVLVVTRVSTAEMNTITPLPGAVVYNTDLQCIHYYNGTEWINVCEEVGGIPNLTTDPFINTRSTIVITTDGENNHIEVAPNSIRTEQIVDGGINGDDIQDNSIGQNKIGNDAVGANELEENAVGAEALNNVEVETYLEDYFTNTVGYITSANILSTDPNNDLTDVDGAFYDEQPVLDAIATNAGDISTNAGNIQTNSDAITVNTGNIGTNTSAISANSTAISDHITNDGDLDDQNETLTSAIIDGNELVLTESGTETRVDLGTFNNTGSDNQNLGLATLTGQNLTINIQNGNPTTANLSALATDAEVTAAITASEATDGDKANNNEIITAASLSGGTNLVIVEAGNTWTIPLASLSGSNGADGSIIDPNGGTDINITGAGTVGDPYVINSTFSEVDGSNTNEIQTLTSPDGSVNITATGPNNTDYLLTVPAATPADGSETEITPGTNITISGDGTSATPYVINATNGAVADGSETEITPGANISITGDGTSATPYVISATGTLSADWASITSKPAGFLDDIDNDTQLTNAEVATAVNSEFPNLDTDSTDDFDGTWGNLTGIPTVLLDGDDDTQYTAGAGLTLSVGNEFAVDGSTIIADWSNLTGIPADIDDGDDNTQLTDAEVALAVNSEFPNLDTDSTDDFDGTWGNLTGIPTVLLDGDDDTQYTAGAGLTLSVGNEFAVDGSTIIADWSNLTGIPADIDDGDDNTQLTDAEVALAVNSEFPNLDTDSTDDFDGTWGNLTGIPTVLLDGDDDTQYTAGTGLTLSVGNEFAVDGSTIIADWSNLTGIPADIDDGDDNTQLTDAEVALAVNSEFPNLDTDSTDDFDGTWGNLTGIPTVLLDGDDDTQYTAGAGLTLSVGNEFAVDGSTIIADWSNLTGIPADIDDGDDNTQLTDAEVALAVNSEFPNLDTDSTDDFDGTWGNLTGIPTVLLDGDDDTQYTAGNGIAISVANEISVDGSSIVAGSIAGSKVVPNFGNQNISTTGTITATGDITTNGNFVDTTPDYVFQTYYTGKSYLNNGYKFMTLSDIEKFTSNNHHLPGIKSALDIKKQGYWSLVESSQINLEKIEELFLHTIEQEKKIDQLQNENKALNQELETLKSDIALIKQLLLTKEANN